MTRLRKLLLSALLGVTGVVGTLVYLDDSGLSGRLCVPTPQDADLSEATWFAAVSDDLDLPAPVGLDVNALPADFQGACYEYRASPKIGASNWRVFAFRGPRVFAKGWRDLAQAQPEVKMLKSWRDVKAACASHFTAAQCRTALTSIHECWYDASTKALCRYGKVAGTNTDCAPTAAMRPWPCDDEGRGPPEAWVDEVPEDM